MRYFFYLLYHKWHVFLECCRLGIPLLGILHDLDKFLLDEFLPMAKLFSQTGSSLAKANDFRLDNIRLSLAKNLHYRRSRHHWESWVSFAGNGAIVELPVPDRYRREMLADWRAAGKATRNMSAEEWYRAYGEKIRLHPDTRAWLEERL